jgi:hypothetical protein
MSPRSSQGGWEFEEDRHSFIQFLSVIPEERGAAFFAISI